MIPCKRYQEMQQTFAFFLSNSLSTLSLASGSLIKGSLWDLCTSWKFLAPGCRKIDFEGMADAEWWTPLEFTNGVKKWN
jgi:hypothetical protein